MTAVTGSINLKYGDGTGIVRADLAQLPAGAATSAKQDTQSTKLDTLHTDLASLLTELGQKLEPGDIAALATAAKQDQIKAAIDAVTAKLPSGGATEATLLLLQTAVNATTAAVTAAESARNSDDDLLRSTVATDAVLQAVRDRLPAALHGDGGLKAHIVASGAAPVFTRAGTLSASIREGNAPVNAVDESSPVVAANANRLALTVQNNGSHRVSLSAGKPAVINGGVATLDPGGSWDGMVGGMLWLGAVTCVTEAGQASILGVDEF